LFLLSLLSSQSLLLSLLLFLLQSCIAFSDCPLELLDLLGLLLTLFTIIILYGLCFFLHFQG
jgi:hypothetical protein